MDMIAELLAGRFREPDTGESLRVPVKSVVIESTLEGEEAALIRGLDLPPPHAVLSDQNTYEVLGRRVEEALGRVIPIRLAGRPVAEERVAAKVMRAGIKAGSYIAVGSGTINDLAKLAAARQNKPYAVFATAPSMNGYASATASIAVNGFKASLPAAPPLGIFADLEVLAGAPKRMIAAGLGDSICRSTAQVDWLMAHRLHGSIYRRLPFELLAEAEEEMIAEPEALARGDKSAVAALMRVLILSGLGMTLCASSAPASQGEHLISHYIETLPPEGWHKALHGEQIAVTTLVMARLQEALLAGPAPVVAPDGITARSLADHFGAKLGAECWRECAPKLLDRGKADALNAKLAAIWPALRDELLGLMRPAERIESILGKAGAPTSYRDLDLGRDYFATAIWHARALRNRYTFLDLAAAARQLNPEKLMPR